MQLTTAALLKKPALGDRRRSATPCAAATQPLMQAGPVMWCLSPSMRPEPGSYVYSVMASTHDSIVAGMNYFQGARLQEDRRAQHDGRHRHRRRRGHRRRSSKLTGLRRAFSIVAQEHPQPHRAQRSGASFRGLKAAGAQAMFAFTATGTPLGTILHFGMADGALDIPGLHRTGQHVGRAARWATRRTHRRSYCFPATPWSRPEKVSDQRREATRVDDFRADMKTGNFPADLLHATPWDATYLIVDAFKRLGPNATKRRSCVTRSRGGEELASARSAATRLPGQPPAAASV